MWSRNLENEEAEARYRAVKIQTQWVVTPGKQINNIGTTISTTTTTTTTNNNNNNNNNNKSF